MKKKTKMRRLPCFELERRAALMFLVLLSLRIVTTRPWRRVTMLEWKVSRSVDRPRNSLDGPPLLVPS